MKTRIFKRYESWVVEFAFGTVVFCHDWASAIETFEHLNDYLLASERVV